MLLDLIRRPRFSRGVLSQGTPRCNQLKEYLAGEMFVCNFGKHLLKPDAHGNSQILILELPKQDIDRLDAIYTALFELLTESTTAILAVEPEEADLPLNFDAKKTEHHELPRQIALDFYRKLYVACECSSQRNESIKSIIKRAQDNIETSIDATQFLAKQSILAPTCAIGRLIQSTMAPTFPKKHPRYAPLTVHAVVPEYLFKAVAHNREEIRSISLKILARSTVPYATTHIYPIPYSWDYSSSSFKDLLFTLENFIVIEKFPNSKYQENQEIARLILHYILAENISGNQYGVQLVLDALRSMGFEARPT